MKIPNSQINSYIQKISSEPIIGCLVYGPDASVVKYRFDFIAKKICSDLSDPFLVTEISKERLCEDKSILGDEFFSNSMMGGRKLIIIKNLDSTAISALKNLLEDKNINNNEDNNFILIQAKELDNKSALRKLAETNPNLASIPCYEDNDQTSRKFIENELAKNQIKFNQQTLNFLLEKLPKNRQIISLEINKIVTFLGEEKQLTTSIAENTIIQQTDSTTDNFIMNFTAKKFDIAFLQLEKLFQNKVEPIMLIRFLSNYLQKIYHAKIALETKMLDFESAVKSQKLFFKTEIEFRKHLKSLTLPMITKILLDLENLEIKIKSGFASPRTLLLNYTKYNLVNL